MKLEFPATDQGAAQGVLVQVLELSPHGDPGGDAGDAKPEGLEATGEVKSGGLALNIGVGGEDHLLDAEGLDATLQVSQAQIIWPNALERGQNAVHDVVETEVGSGALKGHHVDDLPHDAERFPIPGRVPADSARLPFTEHVALSAEDDLAMELDQGHAEAAGIVGGLGENMHSEAGRGALADPRKPREQGGQFVEGGGEHLDVLGANHEPVLAAGEIGVVASQDQMAMCVGDI
jgi:hypothetical protein